MDIEQHRERASCLVLTYRAEPLPTKGFVRHYLGKPDLASRSRVTVNWLRRVRARPLYVGMYCIAPPPPRRACTRNETRHDVSSRGPSSPTREERPQITGSKAQRDRARAPSNAASKAIITSLIRPDLLRTCLSSVKLIRDFMHRDVSRGADPIS